MAVVLQHDDVSESAGDVPRECVVMSCRSANTSVSGDELALQPRLFAQECGRVVDMGGAQPLLRCSQLRE
jgi:hypothetical protein